MKRAIRTSRSAKEPTNAQMLKILRSEIAIFRFDTNNRFDALDANINSMRSDIAVLKHDVHALKVDMKQVKSDLRDLNFKVDQNHICLMTNDAAMEKRIRVLEMK